MQARVRTVAFQGIDVLPVDVQVLVAPGQLAFAMVGLADKAVGESRERVRAAFRALGLALPPQRITVNLSPADLAKEGSHYDLPIALGLLAAMGVVAKESLAGYVVLGELALDGSLTRVPGVLPAAVAAAASGRGVICPAACGTEAAWAGFERAANEDRLGIVAAPSLLALINHLRGQQLITEPQALLAEEAASYPDLAEIKGQETAKRVLEVAAAGGHNLLMIGPPGSGKSMLAARLPGLLPPLAADEALEATMVRSLAGETGDGRLSRRRSFRDPHHSATLQALVGGGARPRPGEVSLAHHGVLFLDELPEFSRASLEALRQPLETGEIVVARANFHIRYPARFQLIAAQNPCKCGLGSPSGGHGGSAFAVGSPLTAALALQAMAHGDARWFALNREVKLPAVAGCASGHESFRGCRYGLSVGWASKRSTVGSVFHPIAACRQQKPGFPSKRRRTGCSFMQALRGNPRKKGRTA